MESDLERRIQELEKEVKELKKTVKILAEQLSAHIEGQWTADDIKKALEIAVEINQALQNILPSSPQQGGLLNFIVNQALKQALSNQQPDIKKNTKKLEDIAKEDF